MEYIFGYERLAVYQAARVYVKMIYALSAQFPQKEEFALTLQIRRAAVSITSNIAEGGSRTSKKEQAHFMEIAYGSLMETFSQLQIAMDINYITEHQVEEIIPYLVDVKKKISALRRSLIAERHQD